MAREDAEMIGKGEQIDVVFDEISEESIKGAPIRTKGDESLRKALGVGSCEVSEVVKGWHEERHPIEHEGKCQDDAPHSPLM